MHRDLVQHDIVEDAVLAIHQLVRLVHDERQQRQDHRFVEQLLGGSGHGAVGHEREPDRMLATVMFTDIAGFSTWSQERDAATVKVLDTKAPTIT